MWKHTVIYWLTQPIGEKGAIALLLSLLIICACYIILAVILSLQKEEPLCGKKDEKL